jgi:F-type H+-transporting ATPase subunit b
MFHVSHRRSECRTRLAGHLRAWVVAVVLIAGSAAGSLAHAAQHEAQHEGGGAAPAPHEQTLLQTVAKIANFAILAGVLVYYLRSPIRAYLVSRATAIRSDLVAASEMRAAAAAQLAEIERKLQSLPSELAALKEKGAEDVAAEQARLAKAAATERERLIQQTRREIDVRLQMARRELTEHAARLAVEVAEARIRQTITPDDQLRLVERYTAQLREVR